MTSINNPEPPRNRLYEHLAICGQCVSCIPENLYTKEGTLSFWYCDMAKDTGIFTTLIGGYIPKNGIIEGRFEIPVKCPYYLEQTLLDE